MELLLPVVGFAVAMAVFFLRDRRAERRRRRVGSGEAVTCRALLGGPTGRLHRGELRLGPGDVTWAGGRHVRPLTGARVLAVAAGAGRQARPDDALLRLRLADGSDARLLLHEADAALVARQLRDQPTTGAPAAALSPVPPGRGPRWPLLVLAVVGLWLLAWAYLAVGGRTVTATVVENDGDGGCDVTWTGPGGQERSAYVDCGDEPAGSTREVQELAPPFTGEAVDAAWTLGSVVVVAALVAAPAVISLARRRWAGEAAPPPEPRGTDPGPDLSPLTDDALAPTFEPPGAVLARLAPYAARQVPPDGWEHPRRSQGASAPSVLRDLPLALFWPVAVLGVVLALTAPAPWRWYVLQTSDTAAADATSTGETAIDGPGPLPDDVTVTYTDRSGSEQRADVATSGALPEGTRVVITYAVDEPGWARVDGPGDGLLVWVLLAAAGALAATAFGAVRALGVVAASRAVASARQQAARPALATLTGAPDGEPLLLVCDPVTQPAEVFAVPVRTPLPHGTAASFPADAALSVRRRGALADDEAVVIELPGATGAMWPGGPAWRPGPDELRFLLDTANVLADDLDDEDGDVDDEAAVRG